MPKRVRSYELVARFPKDDSGWSNGFRLRLAVSRMLVLRRGSARWGLDSALILLFFPSLGIVSGQALGQ